MELDLDATVIHRTPGSNVPDTISRLQMALSPANDVIVHTTVPPRFGGGLSLPGFKEETLLTES